MRTGIVWFKNDLRVQDNTSLQSAIEENDRVIAVYFFDPRLFKNDRFGFKKTGRYRAKFLVESIQDLKQNLTSHNISLLVYNKKPELIFPQLINEFDISIVYLQKEWTSEEVNIIHNVKNSIIKFEVDFVEQHDQFLFHPNINHKKTGYQ